MPCLKIISSIHLVNNCFRRKTLPLITQRSKIQLETRYQHTKITRILKSLPAAYNLKLNKRKERKKGLKKKLENKLQREALYLMDPI